MADRQDGFVITLAKYRDPLWGVRPFTLWYWTKFPVGRMNFGMPWWRCGRWRVDITNHYSLIIEWWGFK